MFMRLKCGQALRLKNTFGFIGKQNSISVKRNSHFMRVCFRGMRRMGVDLSGRNAGIQGGTNIGKMRR